MRNKEYTALVLQKLREGKTEKEIALETQRHRNTVSRHVNWLRQNFAIEPKLLTNEILSKLKERINEMTDRDLVRFLSVLMPQKIEAHTIEEVKVEEKHVTIIADYARAVEAAVNRDIEALRSRKQMDTPRANTETS